MRCDRRALASMIRGDTKASGNPRSNRFTLGDRVEAVALDVLEALHAATENQSFSADFVSS
jgi:hypothetical protein